MPPDATDMITSDPPPSQAVRTNSYYPAVSKHVGGSDRNGDDSDRKMSKKETSNGPGNNISHPSNAYSSNSYAVSHTANGHTHDMNSMPAPENGHADNRYLDAGDQVESDQRQSTRQDQEHADGGESQQNGKEPLKEPLHKTLYDNFHSELDSLRDATIEALQLSCCEQERLCVEGEELEARIAYMRKKIGLARDELLSKGETDEGLRMSMVKEGEEEISISSNSMLGTLDETESTEHAEPKPTPSMSRKNSSGGLHGSFVSKRFSMRNSSLHGSQTTQFSKGSATSESTAMPHMSRQSLIGMLGASKNWLDSYANSTSNETDPISRDSSVRISFVDGAGGDEMPSRWRAREKEREKTAKQKEGEERRSQQKVIDKKNGAVDGNGSTSSLPKKERSKEETLQHLISKREGEISSLERRTVSVEQQTSSLRDEVSMLQVDQQQEQSEFERERKKLLEEIDEVEYDNERLDHMLVETAVSVEEKKIIIVILANELKGARDQLAHIQNERDRQRSARRRKKRSRQWGGGLRNSVSSLLGLDAQEQKSESVQDQQGKARYQVPPDALQQYRTLVNSSDDDTSGDNLDESGRGDDDGNSEPGMDRRRSHASVGTCMSSLTMDSRDLVDILEQLELDT